MRLGVVAGGIVAAAMLVSSVALAANVGGTYKGTTSQHHGLTLKLTYKNGRLYAALTTKFTYKCPSGSKTQSTGFSGAPVKRDGTVYSVFAGGGPTAFDSNYRWQIHGKKLSGSATASFEVSGGECRSGEVRFTAKR